MTENHSQNSGQSHNDPGEQWYLRIDDKEFGPVSRSQMEYFLRPPRLCSLLMVRCTIQDGIWHSISRTETIDKVLYRFGIHDEPVRRIEEPLFPVPVESRFDIFRGLFLKVWKPLASWVVRHRIECSFVVAVMFANLIYMILNSDGLDRQRKIFAQFEAIWADIREIDPELESNDEWREIADNAIEELNSLLQELSNSHSTSEAHQRLLFLGREQLLPILNSAAASATDSKQALSLEAELKRLRKLLMEKANNQP